MVWIVVDHDLIAVPQPIRHIVVVNRGHAEIEAAEPEALPIAPRQMKDVSAPDAARESPVLPGMVQMKPRVVFAGIVADPLTIRMHVRSLRMSRLVGKRLALRGRRGIVRRGLCRRRSALWNKTAGMARIVSAIAVLFVTLPANRHA